MQAFKELARLVVAVGTIVFAVLFFISIVVFFWVKQNDPDHYMWVLDFYAWPFGFGTFGLFALYVIISEMK